MHRRSYSTVPGGKPRLNWAGNDGDRQGREARSPFRFPSAFYRLRFSLANNSKFLTGVVPGDVFM